MKTNRIGTIVLAVLAVSFAFLWLSAVKKPAVEQVRERWHTNTVQVEHTNTVELWRTNTLQVDHTNTVVQWRTNTLQVQHTNTVVQMVTNEVIKEVPARLSAQEKQAGAAGVKYLNAPVLVEAGNELYKASPIAVEVQLDASATKILKAGPDDVRPTVEATLGSRNIPVAAQSPHQLRLAISGTWQTDVPRVAGLLFTLALRERVALQRGSDQVKCPAAVWSTRSVRLIGTVNTSEELKQTVKDTVARFCDDYAKSKESEKEVDARLPAIPPVFLQ